MLEKLANLDRRWIFLAIALAVTLPLLFPLHLPVRPSQQSQKFYDTVEALPPGSIVCMSFDYGPGTKIECHPMATAMLHHLFRHKCRVICMALWPEGALFSREALAEVAPQYKMRDGIDYVNLGYKNGGEVILRGVGDDFRKIYSCDLKGRPLADLELMDEVRGWNSIDLVVDWSIGRPGLLEFVRVVSSQYGRPFLAGTTASTTSEAYPFLNSGQVISLLGGLRGASEYEVLLDIYGTATRAMDAQSVVHFVIAAFIILANLVYFSQRRRQSERSSANGH